MRNLSFGLDVITRRARVHYDHSCHPCVKTHNRINKREKGMTLCYVI